ncbi:MAG: hypothetical protein IKK34_04595 [Clostridia bacterium]|nr:hypothetical protein [Clostridia bacterium]
MKYVLGLDQGGSKTHAVVADMEGNILGIGCGAGACHSVIGLEAAAAAIYDASMQAMSAAGITAEQIDVVGAGLTGVDWPHETQLLRQAVSDTLSIPQEKIIVVNDCLIALRAGTSKPSGCILCAGSGLNCAVRHPDGREYTFGFYIEDGCQGGSALGMRTLQAVFDAEAGLCAETALTEKVLRYMACSNVDEMLFKHVTCGLGPDRILRLPPVLEEAALEGDEVAKGILRVYARDIARYVVVGLRRFDMLNLDMEVVLSGSIFKCRAPELIDTVTDVILSNAPNVTILESIYEPVIGAMLLALDHIEDADRALIQEHIERDAKRFHMVRKD